MRCSWLGIAPLVLPQRGGRSSGVHLSGVIRAILEDMGHRRAEENPSSACRMAVGLAWEDFYGPLAFGDNYHPGEYEYEGVFFTPDAVDWRQQVVYEIKTTSRRETDPSKVLAWMLQIQGYLWGIGRGEWRRAEFHVLTLGYQPEVHVWSLQFEPRELQSVWELIQKYKHKAKPEDYR